MSLGIVIKSPEGLVLAAESRITLGVKKKSATGTDTSNCYFDHATKLISFAQPNEYIGVVTYGQAVIGQSEQRTAASFLPEFESTLPSNRLSVEDFAKRVSQFYLDQWKRSMPPIEKSVNIPDMTFVVAGFDENDIYGKVFVIDIPRRPVPQERSAGTQFGITYGGQIEYIHRLSQGFDFRLPQTLTNELQLNKQQQQKLNSTLGKYASIVPYNILALQDCIDLAKFYINTTIEAQRLSVGTRGVGGEIDIAFIRRGQKINFVNRKMEHF
ncbi:MAG TPA: hypothetical protein PK537_03855 [Candidatus Limiplasma sp.]|nr:hypothetical protein [Candidatus Limiplasma sp.]